MPKLGGLLSGAEAPNEGGLFYADRVFRSGLLGLGLRGDIELSSTSTVCSLLRGPGFRVLTAYRDRIVSLSEDPRFKYVLIFKNQGRSAGASLEHSHSQLIGLPIVPELVQEELSGGKFYYNYKERCVFCDMIRQELQQQVRVVLQNQEFLAICPFAPRSPFEIWILPKHHYSSYVDLGEGSFPRLAELFSETLKRLEAALGKVPYNFILHTSPIRESQLSYYHWHFEIVPKLTLIAGFEWGSGFYINPTPPEDAAKYLRELTL